jgi:hypothetical protein
MSHLIQLLIYNNPVRFLGCAIVIILHTPQDLEKSNGNYLSSSDCGMKGRDFPYKFLTLSINELVSLSDEITLQ